MATLVAITVPNWGMSVIHVSYVDPIVFSDLALARRHLDFLDDDEQRRHESYVFDEHRQEYLAGCVIAKKAIAMSHGMHAKDIRFLRDRYGRPHVSRPEGLGAVRFSISHTPGCAICAVSLGPEIGVDVERVDRPAERLPISSTCLCALELGL